MNELEQFSLDDRRVLMAANAMDSLLLITGESGTGKSYLAELMHKLNPRRANGRFHKINLATLSEHLIESELFGHERGAFTGADQKRIGRLEICNGGTVFLDEIGELTPRLQAKLLEFIQYKKISPVGSNREMEMDVRIIAATNKKLENEVKAGRFREDLYHRLKVFHVELPVLRDQSEKIIDLSKELLKMKSQKISKSDLEFSQEVLNVFKNYNWPGNIRELENVIEFAVGLEFGRIITIKSLPAKLQKISTEIKKLELDKPIELKQDKGTAIGFLEVPFAINYYDAKDAFEKRYLDYVLRYHAGQINVTSRSTGLNKVSLNEKLKRFEMDWRAYR